MAKAKHALYRPHARVTEDGEIVNHITGEVSRPPSMTKQEFAKECDINNIIKAFSITGQFNHISAKAASGAFIDLPDKIDLQTSLSIIEEANAAFGSLPAHVRDRFHNDPANFLEFSYKLENLPEMRKMGLAPEAPPEPPKAPEPASPPSKPDA